MVIKKGSRWKARGSKTHYRVVSIGNKAVHCATRSMRKGKRPAGRYSAETVAVPRSDFGKKLIETN